MPPHITEYLDFVDDKTLFIFMKNGDITIDVRMSTVIAKTYIYIYWDKLIQMGNSPTDLWNAMSSLRNENEPLHFDQHGYQINKPAMLALENTRFIGLMSEDRKSKYWFVILRIFVYLIFSIAGFYVVRNLEPNTLWAKLVSFSKHNHFM